MITERITVSVQKGLKFFCSKHWHDHEHHFIKIWQRICWIRCYALALLIQNILLSGRDDCIITWHKSQAKCISCNLSTSQSFFINPSWFFLFCLFVSWDDYRQTCNFAERIKMDSLEALTCSWTYNFFKRLQRICWIRCYVFACTFDLEPLPLRKGIITSSTVEIASKMHSIQSFFINSYLLFLFWLFVSGDDYRQDYCNFDRKDQNHFAW
jgi:hypothetical protein